MNFLFRFTGSVPLFLLGFSVIIVQIIFVRESLNLLNGNELVIGLVYALWMVFTALGAKSGKKIHILNNSGSVYWLCSLLYALLPVLLLFSLHFFRNIMFHPGEMLGLVQTSWYISVHLLPVCFLSGFLFTVYSEYLIKNQNCKPVSQSYAVESLGSVVGAGILSFLLVYFFTPFTILKCLAFINLLVAAVFISFTFTKKCLVQWIITGVCLIVLYIYPFEEKSLQSRFFNQELISYTSNPFGDIAVTLTGSQVNLYENGALILYSHNEIDREETVHFAMAQRPQAKRALLISGGLGGMIPEILKYPVETLDYLEINRFALKELKDQIPGLTDRRVNTYSVDPIRYLKTTKSEYDMVINAVPDPVNARLNRYYTTEFFSQVKQLIMPGGVFITRLGVATGYLNKTDQFLVSCLHTDLKMHFKEVLLIPAEKLYFIASDSGLTLNITDVLTKMNIQTAYVNSSYYQVGSIQFRVQQIKTMIVPQKSSNSNVLPLLYLNFINRWMMQFSIGIWWFYLILCAGLVLMLWVLFMVQPPISSIFFTGFTTSAMQMLLLFAFQVFLGFMYSAIALLTMVFMTGLALGPLIAKRFELHIFKNMASMQLFVALIAIIMGLGFYFFNTINFDDFWISGVFFSGSFLISLMAGMQYHFSTTLTVGTTADKTSKNYSADLFGAALSAFLFPVFLLPLVGLVKSAFILALLNAVMFIILLLKSKTVLKSGK